MKKKFIYYVLSLALLAYFIVIVINYKVDALGLNSKQNYYLKDASYARYQNIGIAKNNPYETIITGTSLSENFKTSLSNKIFATKTIKIPMSGASAKEQNILVSKAISKNTKRVIWDIHYTAYHGSSDRMHKSYEFPLFLYDDNKLNDLKFYGSFDAFKLSVKKILFKGKYFTNNFDDLYNWYTSDENKFGKENVKAYVKSFSKKIADSSYNKEYGYRYLKENFDKNILPIVASNPNVSFEFYFPPYTPYYFLGFYKTDMLDDIIMFKQYFIENSFKHKNMHIHDFSVDYSTLENLNNYKDTHHFSQAISDDILTKISHREFEVDQSEYLEKNIENYQQYLEKNLGRENDIF